MLSCGRVKTELFENADVTALLYDVPEHAHGSLGITQGHFDCLLSFVKVRTAEFECRSVFVWTEIFRKRSSCGRGYFYTDKKDAFSKISGYVWTRPFHFIFILYYLYTKKPFSKSKYINLFTMIKTKNKNLQPYET